MVFAFFFLGDEGSTGVGGNGTCGEGEDGGEEPWEGISIGDCGVSTGNDGDIGGTRIGMARGGEGGGGGGGEARTSAFDGLGGGLALALPLEALAFPLDFKSGKGSGSMAEAVAAISGGRNDFSQRAARRRCSLSLNPCLVKLSQCQQD